MLSFGDVYGYTGNFPHTFTCKINLLNVNNLFKSKKLVQESRRIIRIIVRFVKDSDGFRTTGIRKQLNNRIYGM